MSRDLCDVGALFNCPFPESARTHFDRRDLDIGVQFDRARLCPIRRSHASRCGIHYSIFDRLDAGRRAIANALALVADWFACRVDFDRGRIQQNCAPKVNRASVAREKFVSWNCSPWSCLLDVANSARLVEKCRHSQELISLAGLRLCFIRRYVRSARRQSACGNIFAPIVTRNFPGSCRRFARNAPNRSTARSRRHFPAPTARTALCTLTLRSPLIAAAGSRAM